MTSEVGEKATDEVFAVIQSLLVTTESNSQGHKVLTVLHSFFQQTLGESFAKLESERKLRQACEDQLLGLSTKVNDLKREYSNTLALREEEISNYEKENRKLSESNKKRADNLSKVRMEWTKLSSAPEILQKRKEELINLERGCFLKHVSYGDENTGSEVIKNCGDGFLKNDVEVMNKVPLEQLRTEVAKTWVLINKQQRVLEKLLDQFYTQLEGSNNQSLLHDCNGNVTTCGVPQLPFVIPPENPGNKVTFQQNQNDRSGEIVERNTTFSLLDALISIGSLCKNGPSVVRDPVKASQGNGHKKVEDSKLETKNHSKPSSIDDQQSVPNVSTLEQRIKKYEEMVRNFDRTKVVALKDKLAAKIAKLEMQASYKLNA